MQYARQLRQFLERRGLRSGVIVGTGQGPAAGAVADGSLDFVYLDAATEYGPVCDLLRDWYPKVRPGGFFGGIGYLDGLLHGNLYGVRTAVNELVRKHDLVVRLTLDQVQSWFVFKPTEKPSPQPSPGGRGGKPARKLRIALLTAYDQRQRDIAAISSPNKAQYCRLHGYDFIEETSNFPKDRSAVWAKIVLLQKHLARYDWVFWSDADSLVMDLHKPLGTLCDPEADLVICHEDLGQGVYNINAGQMLLRSSEWSQEFLEDVWDQTWALKDPHQEQRAIIHLLFSEDLSGHVHVVAQRTFNCYLGNFARGDFLLHFPDMPNDKRIEAMRYWAQFAIS